MGFNFKKPFNRNKIKEGMLQGRSERVDVADKVII